MSEEFRPALLLVDDERNTREGLRKALKHKFSVFMAESAAVALDILASENIDIMLSDVRMPGMDGLELLKSVNSRYPSVVCILITAYGNVEIAVEAMKRGAADFLIKPVNLDHLELTLLKEYETRKIREENVYLRSRLDSKFGMENIIGGSEAMESVFDVVRQAAPSQANILIQGPSGTGKELIAQAVHRLSSRSNGPFIAVHCAALTPTLLESELFGHERGAFTGATGRRRGRFELADGGTLFLDEISEIDQTVQVKLLRVLEERTFERVGGDETIEVDIRLIAATNRDLRQSVAEGKFREDLYYRLDVVSVQMPPLSERVDDIPILAGHFLKEFNAQNRKDIRGMTTEAMAVLQCYDWPGNVRELRNTVEKMVVLARGDRLGVRDLPPNIRDAVRSKGDCPDTSAAADKSAGKLTETALLKGSLADMERMKIMAVLDKCDGNRTLAAKELGISRRTLHRKLSEWNQSGESGSN